MRISIFFDGTGNNLQADQSTGEHSNVARLFQAHSREPAQGIHAYYVPGIGTYFREIGDPGGELLGNGAGGKGEARLQWAMSKLEEVLSRNDGRQTIHLALFGFSRGATLARAFALRIAQKCQRRGDGVWRLTLGQRTSPIRLYFMGLFDTVASVGTPLSLNNTASVLMSTVSTRAGMMDRNARDLSQLAFGTEPGADPAPGLSTGHWAWANDLRIPEMVEDCLHMVAAHELRNSFPVDSLLQGSEYPANCREMLYPGAHSDVGGGYRPGEGARSRTNGSLLSMIPLRVMRDQAIQAGVPLVKVPNDQDFAEDTASKESFELLHQRFCGYMNAVGWSEQPLGVGVLAHMKRYYQWRFHRIARDKKDRESRRPTKDEALLSEFQARWKTESKDLSKETAVFQRKYFAQAQRTSELSNSFGAQRRQQILRKEQLTTELMKNDYLSLKARLDTLPNWDGSFLESLKVYDAQLLEDVRAIQALAKFLGRQKLRPHYQQLLQAYEDEQRGQGLKDQTIIQFFDTYVHDSLAAFAQDSTLPSDPRVIYTGGNNKMKYAVNQPRSQAMPHAALG